MSYYGVLTLETALRVFRYYSLVSFMIENGGPDKMLRRVINCDDFGWGFQLLSCLETKSDAELVNCDSSVHGDMCRKLAEKFSMLLDIYPETKSVWFSCETCLPVHGKSLGKLLANTERMGRMTEDLLRLS